MTFNWLHFLLLMVGCFVGSFLYTVWQNERKARKKSNAPENAKPK